jgi:hypothetical protein
VVCDRDPCGGGFRRLIGVQILLTAAVGLLRISTAAKLAVIGAALVGVSTVLGVPPRGRNGQG